MTYISKVRNGSVDFHIPSSASDVVPADTLHTALGITEDVEKYSLKGTRRKKGKKLDDEDLVRVQHMNHTVAVSSHLFPAPIDSDGRG